MLIIKLFEATRSCMCACSKRISQSKAIFSKRTYSTVKTYRSSIPQTDAEERLLHFQQSQKDVLLYSNYSKKNLAVMLGFYAVGSFFFFVTAYNFHILGVAIREGNIISRREEDKETKRWGMSLWKFKDGKFHSYFAAALGAISFICLMVSIYLPARYVKAIVKLKGSEKVCLQTYAPFGRSKYLTLEKSQLHTTQPYTEKRNALIATHKHWTPFYLSGRGTVHQGSILKDYLKQRKTKN